MQNVINTIRALLWFSLFGMEYYYEQYLPNGVPAFISIVIWQPHTFWDLA